MFENTQKAKGVEGSKSIDDLRLLSNEELGNKARLILREEIRQLTQEEINERIGLLIIEIAHRDMSGFALFANAVPNTCTAEEIQSGSSLSAKIYRALFEFSRTDEYKKDPAVQGMTRELENIIDQDPQMMGPVAMWQIAKDVMWRRDVPSHVKGSLTGSMTYALAFFDTDRYEAELLKNLDFENTENYAEVAHMLEALKQFWSEGHESYAENRVPDFYLRALRKIRETPEANYLLSVRAREILSMLEQSDDFPVEARDLKPFELSKGMYASTQVGEGLTVIPQENNPNLEKTITNFDVNEKKITPPQWMVDEAIANGETWISWQPPQDLLRNRTRLFNDMHQFASVPIDTMIGSFSNLDASKKDEMMFDYEYLVSRPIREMVQREFNFALKDLTIREQFYFLNYLKRVKVANADLMKHFISLYGINGMRTFLSLERGDESLGDQIVAFGQHDGIAGKVFSYYGELLDSADRAEALVRRFSNCEGDVCVDLTNQVRENIINRAQKDIENAVTSNNPSAIAAQIENYVASAKEYVALLQEIGAGKIEALEPSELTNEEQERMKSLLHTNYAKAYPEPENDAFTSAVAGSLEKSFSNPNTTFRILRDNKKIVSYNRFDTISDFTGREISYFGSFNADPAYSGVGGIMLEKTIKERLADGRPMMAHCDPTQAITRKYIEDGFVATQYYSLAGKLSFEIWRSQNSGMQLESKNKTIEELMSNKSESTIVREQNVTEGYPELKDGKALTRYFIHEGKTYLVFETLPNNLQETFTPPQEEQKKAA